MSVFPVTRHLLGSATNRKITPDSTFDPPPAAQLRRSIGHNMQTLFPADAGDRFAYEEAPSIHPFVTQCRAQRRYENLAELNATREESTHGKRSFAIFAQHFT